MKEIWGIYRHDNADWVSNLIYLFENENDAVKRKKELEQTEKTPMIEYTVEKLILNELGENHTITDEEEEYIKSRGD